jgi:hypothetical protein
MHCLLFTTIQQEARIWFNHGSNYPPRISVWCCSAALHFAAGDDRFQSEIYSIRALSYYELEDLAKSERDINFGKKLNIDLTLVGSKSLFYFIYLKQSFVRKPHHQRWFS